MPADEAHRALAAELPESLGPVQTEVVSGEKRKHISGLTEAEYEVELEPDDAIDLPALEGGVAEVLDAGELPVTRETKSKTRVVDIRPGIHELTVFEPRPDGSGRGFVWANCSRTGSSAVGGRRRRRRHVSQVRTSGSMLSRDAPCLR